MSTGDGGADPALLHHRVRYHESDAQGFLFNSRYLEIADVAMTEFFRSIGWTYAELNAAGVDPSVVTATLSFSAPAMFDELLSVWVRCTRVGTSSFDLVVELCRAQDRIATVELVYVNVDAESATSRPLTVAVAEALRNSG